MQNLKLSLLVTAGAVLLLGIAIWLRSERRQRRRLRAMAQDVIDALNHVGVKYWVDFGTLLGIHREGDIILHDNDIDVCLPSVTEELLECFGTHIVDQGYRFEAHVWPTISRVYESSGLYTDLYHVALSDDGAVYHGATGSNSDVPADLIGTLQTINWTVHGRTVTVSVPENVPGVLEWRYGEDYMKPRRGHKGRDG